MAAPSKESPTIRDRFEAAVDIVHSMPKTGPVPSTHVEKLLFYSLYKQATLGPCNVSAPAFWNLIEKYKWDAWKQLGEMSQEEAMTTYVQKIQEKIDYVAEKFDVRQWLQEPDFDRLEPILREKFRLIDRELVKSDGTAEILPKSEAQAASSTAPSNHEEDHGEVVVSDNEYCDARDDHHDSLSRSSSFDVHDDESSRLRSLRGYCARIEVELRSLSAQMALRCPRATTSLRHKAAQELGLLHLRAFSAVHAHAALLPVLALLRAHSHAILWIQWNVLIKEY